MFRGDRDVPAGSVLHRRRSVRIGIRLRHSAPRSLMNAGVLRRCRRGARLATTHGSATWPDALRPVHRHNEGARELPIGWRSSTIAVALRQTQQRPLASQDDRFGLISTPSRDPRSHEGKTERGLPRLPSFSPRAESTKWRRLPPPAGRARLPSSPRNPTRGAAKARRRRKAGTAQPERALIVRCGGAIGPGKRRCRFPRPVRCVARGRASAGGR